MRMRLLALTCGLAFLSACGADGAKKFGGEPPDAEATFGACAFCHKERATSMAAKGGHKTLDLKCTLCHDNLLPGEVGPGHRRVPACTECHSEKVSHQGQECTVCHNPHGSMNIFLIREEIGTPNGGVEPVEFTSEAGRADGSFASETEPGTGVCEICHTETRHYRADGTGEKHFNFPCVDCHAHNRGFLPPNPIP